METKKLQVKLLLDNLRFFINEVKKESKQLKYDSEGDLKFVRKCKGCRKKINLKTRNSNFDPCSADELYSDDENE